MREVPLERRVHRRPVDDGPSSRMVPQLLLGEGGPEDIFGHPPPPLPILGSDANLVMQAEARVTDPVLATSSAGHVEG